MNKKILLYQLRALLEIAPDFNAYTPDSEIHLRWMNSIHTLIYQWKPFPAIAVSNAIEFMPSEAERSKNIEQIFNIAHHAIEQLQVEIEASLSSGAVSNNNSEKDLATLLSTANQYLFVVDSDCDVQKLEFYLDSLKEQVKLRLLVGKLSAEAIAELKKMTSQSGTLVEVKVATAAAEKIVFVDDLNSWGSVDDGYQANLLLSESITPLPPEVMQLKRHQYEATWATAQSV
ncbi:MAG: hypothetical protein RI960_1402 [Pseudomonadota bacterium]